MAFFEIDFLEAGESKSGDAIALRYGELNGGLTTIHVVDGGYADDGQKLVDHIRAYYDDPDFIDHVVLTHPDGDHAAGLQKVLEDFDVGALWMNRPWNQIGDLLPRFEYEYTEDGLKQRLKKDFPHTAALEKIANERGIPIYDAFQGAVIGEFTVLAPSYTRYLDLIVESERTPEPEREATIAQRVFEKVVTIARYVSSLWGEENLKGDTVGTSRENEASIVQYANLSEKSVLLMGDAGVEALEEAYAYAAGLGVSLPGIDRFQVPHHGSRRNLSSEILDKWLGQRLPDKPDTPSFTAIISANEEDADHPRKAVVRALMHRGAKVITTEGGAIRTHRNGPKRDGWSPVTPLTYPTDQEE